MLERDILIPARVRLSGVGRIVEACCVAEGLRLNLKGTLAKYPGSVHWHYQRGAERGTLEITLWQNPRRLWLKVAAGRSGEWMPAGVPRLRWAIERRLRAKT